ncbi:MAG: tRNA (adenosine(37)-N6)-threonylcarbamoyltransferase complex transferase subunit TsaD [Dehalococcoidia bacterium]|nr:tRNA (adenosine(37)-N6)-threonylcarbamoyltransferase complex transferase subunit TsaD [Dehalococcoidia bacterium]MDW8120495.1 tRNA (adenosine(37)-N6)-threonylcarbamoyltransferase complex transferase subunit TsaD [Chloroflexota bacterium]
MLILGIETSCDETGIGLVSEGRTLHANTIASQVELHARYGGVVPEVASRQHVLALVPTLQRALQTAKATLADVDAIAVTYGPGLVGALVVGVNFAKGLAMALNKPLIGINHLEGHIYAGWLEPDLHPEREPGFPLLCLLVSGGHTDLVVMRGHGDYTLLGRTRDDAAGEAFDKAARVLGLGFPGGPEIQREAQKAQAPEPLPRVVLKEGLEFSFSGLKTALVRRAQAAGVYPAQEGMPAPLTGPQRQQKVADLAAGFQEAVVEALVEKTLEAVRSTQVRGILLGGGVAANALLRQRMRERSPVPVLIPRPSLCTDNGAMIAAAAYYRLRRGERHPWNLDADPSLRVG